MIEYRRAFQPGDWRTAATMLVLCALMAGCGQADSRWSKTKPSRETTPATPEVADALAEVAKNPHSARARYALGTQYYQLGNLRDAAEQFRRSLELDPQNAEALMGLWQIAASLNETGNLVPLAAQASQLDPSDPRARAALREAAATFERAAIGRPQDPWLLLNTALCYAKLREWDKAESFTREAARVTPDTMPPRLMLATLFLDQGLTEQAERELEKLTGLFPNNAQAHEALGRARRAKGDLTEALKEFLVAQKLRPDWAVPWMNAGDTYLQRGQYELAEAAFKKAREIEPRAMQPGFALLQTYSAWRQFERGVEVCEKMLVDYPNHPALLNNLAYLYAESGRNLDRAIVIAQQLVDGDPQNAVVRDTLGWALHQSGRQDAALAQLKQAVRLAPKAGGYHFHLAQVQLAVGRKSDAAESLRAALELGLSGADKTEAEKLLATL